MILRDNPKILAEQLEKRPIVGRSKGAAKPLAGKPGVGDLKFVKVVPVEFIDHLRQRHCVEIQPALLPGESVGYSGRSEGGHLDRTSGLRHARGHRYDRLLAGHNEFAGKARAVRRGRWSRSRLPVRGLTVPLDLVHPDLALCDQHLDVGSGTVHVERGSDGTHEDPARHHPKRAGLIL